MQIPSVPPPILTNALPQDVAAKAVPNVQAAAPLIQNAVAQAPKGEKSDQRKDHKNRDKDRNGDDKGKEAQDKKDGHVNIRV
jgi:hypothetical protein